jgi:hypothetical protein
MREGAAGTHSGGKKSLPTLDEGDPDLAALLKRERQTLDRGKSLAYSENPD